MANVSDESSNNKINIVTNVENNVTVTQPNIQTVTVKTGPIGPAGAAGVSGSDGAPGATGTLTNNTGASITGSLIVTGTVSASLVTAITGSFTHIKGNSPITIQDSVTFQQPVTGSIFSGSFVGDGTNITGVTVTLPSGLLSGSSQIATEISGAFASPFTSAGISGSFTTPSSSISARITTLENNPAVASGTVSSSLQITQLGFVTSSATASFVTNSQTGSFITTLPSGLLSGSAQIATEISGAFASPFTSAGITGSFNISSASFSSRVTSLEAGGGSGFTSAGISGSLGANATLIRSLTAVGISGSFVAPSASFSTRVTTLESGGGGGSGIFTDSNGFKVTDNNLIISSSGTKQLSSSLSVQGSGSAIFDVQGSVGQLFEVQDGLDGVLMSVNDISGIPILTVSSSGNIIIPNASRLIGTASVALSVPGVSAAFPFTGNALITGDLDITGSGDDIFKVRSKSGSLFSVDDGLDGILMSVNDISGLPLFEVDSSGNVEIHEGNVSGSSTSTGSFGHIIGDGSQLSNLPAATLPTGVLSGSAQIATEISGAFGIVSSSLASRIATVEDHEHSTFALKTAVSGAFAAPSASFSTRTTALESNPVFSASSISGSSNALSASFSTRVTTNTTNITLLTAATSSYLTSLPTGVLSGSAQIASNISGIKYIHLDQPLLL
jgi:collagen type VII alpha